MKEFVNSSWIQKVALIRMRFFVDRLRTELVSDYSVRTVSAIGICPDYLVLAFTAFAWSPACLKGGQILKNRIFREEYFFIFSFFPFSLAI